MKYSEIYVYFGFNRFNRVHTVRPVSSDPLNIFVEDEKFFILCNPEKHLFSVDPLGCGFPNYSKVVVVVTTP